MNKLPLWNCHAPVEAAKIVEINLPEPGLRLFTLVLEVTEDIRTSVQVPRDYIDRFSPEPGGYFVRHGGSVGSYMRGDAMDEHYSRAPQLVPTSAADLASAAPAVPAKSPMLLLACVAAMREAAAKLVQGDPEDLRRRGHNARAADAENDARRIRSIDVEQLVIDLIGHPLVAPEEVDAFEEEMRREGQSISKRDDGSWYHHMTLRFWHVWRAAVRWEQAQK